MSKTPPKTITIELTDMQFQNVKNAASSYGMSPRDFVLNCTLKLTAHRIEQLRKEKKDKPLIQLV